jgi:hypothetical protein
MELLCGHVSDEQLGCRGPEADPYTHKKTAVQEVKDVKKEQYVLMPFMLINCLLVLINTCVRILRRNSQLSVA